MSKSRKSPRKRPTNTPPQEVKKPEQTTLLTRRNVLIGLGLSGAAALAWRAGLFDVFEDKGKKESETSEQTDKLSEYEKWASKIRLPEMTLLNTPGQLPDTKIPAESLEKFGKAYEQLLGKFRQDFDAQDTAEARYKLSTEFIGSLIAAYRSAIGSGETGGGYEIGSKEFNELMLRVNELLINRGHYLDIEGYRDENPETVKTRISAFDVEGVRSLRITDGDKEHTAPVVLIGNQKDFYNRPGRQEVDHARVNGQYNQSGRIIIHHREGAEVQLDNNIRAFETRCARAGAPYKFANVSRIKKDHEKMTIMHEGMHYALDMRGFMPGVGKKVRNKGYVDMGAYKVSPEKYVGKFNTQIHELAAIGYGIMHAGEAAPIFPTAIIIEELSGYKLAVDIMAKEFYGHMSREDKARVSVAASDGSQTIDANRFTSVISKMPLETLHKIGERMAKLGIYLTQN